MWRPDDLPADTHPAGLPTGGAGSAGRTWPILGSVDDDAIRLLLKRLARAHPSGGTVIERAAIVAEGTGSEAVLGWIVAHGGQAEATVVTPARRGLHGSDLRATGGSGPAVPSRYILPAGALD
jgi:hypothetical protein